MCVPHQYSILLIHLRLRLCEEISLAADSKEVLQAPASCSGDASIMEQIAASSHTALYDESMINLISDTPCQIIYKRESRCDVMTMFIKVPEDTREAQTPNERTVEARKEKLCTERPNLPRKRPRVESLVALAMASGTCETVRPKPLPCEMHMLPPMARGHEDVFVREAPTLPAPATAPVRHSDTPRNNSEWTARLEEIMHGVEGLPSLICLGALSLLRDRHLCFGLARAGVAIAESANLEADIIVSPRTAVVFQQVGALSIDGNKLASHLGGLSDRFSHVVVVLISTPNVREPKEGVPTLDSWSRAAIESFKKLQHSVSRQSAVIMSIDEVAATLKTKYEYVLSQSAVMSGAIVRICAHRDQLCYVSEAGVKFAQAMFSARDYLRWDIQLVRINVDRLRVRRSLIEFSFDSQVASS
jgi:hypothetical protein